ncbi:MAG: tetratricopeptide repeat protein [Candidatus Omnitrophota bacterium]
MIFSKLMRTLFVAALLLLPSFYSQAQSSVKENAQACRDRGYALQSIGDAQGALTCYQKAVQIDPHFTQAHNDLGVIYESLGDIEGALAMYEKVLKLDSLYLPAYTNIAFICEKKGEIEKAADYWEKRYKLGKEGDYWREAARQHLYKLGAYPQIRKEILEEEAAQLSQKLIMKREQEELKLIKEAKYHFNIGSQAFYTGDYSAAIEEFNAVILLNPPHKELQEEAKGFLKKARQFQLRDNALTETQHALDYIKSSDYASAEKKLEKALSAVLCAAQKNKD